MPQTYLKKHVLALILLVSCSFSSFLLSQEFEDIVGVEEKGILYNRISHYGIMLHTNGIGVNYRYGKNLSGYSYLMGDFQLLSMRHPKEVKSINPFSDNNSGFIYGKLNSVNILRTGIGKQKTLNAKGDKGGVEISLAGYAGASWAFVKPVYLTIFEFSDQIGVKEVIQRYDPAEHYPDNISGRASVLRGINELQIYPGLYASFLVNLEFGKEQTRLKMVETGATLDVFPKAIPMMAFSPNSNYFFTFFIRILMGKKWNK
ncbi:MAG: hypothetical protein WED33_05740 [Bacteroidia bacterium]